VIEGTQTQNGNGANVIRKNKRQPNATATGTAAARNGKERQERQQRNKHAAYKANGQRAYNEGTTNEVHHEASTQTGDGNAAT